MPRPLLLALVLLTACGPTFYVEGEVERICKDSEEFEVQGIPEQFAALQPADAGVTFETPFDLAQALPGDELPELNAETRLAEVKLTLTAGVESFDFVEEATFELVAPEGSNVPSARAFALTHQGTQSTLELALEDRDVDLRPYLGEGTGTIKTTLRGQLPSKTWRAKVQACLHVKARYDVL